MAKRGPPSDWRQHAARRDFERLRQELQARQASSSTRTTQQRRSTAWKLDRFTLPREEARQAVREYRRRYPAEAYMTAIEHWEELADGRIAVTMRRLPTSD